MFKTVPELKLGDMFKYMGPYKMPKWGQKESQPNETSNLSKIEENEND